MFDIGFTELMVIGVVALIVIGPERLPKVARTMGHLFGRLQRYVNDVKADISREIELDELRKFKTTFEDAARSVETSVRDEVAKTEFELQSLKEAADKDGADGEASLSGEMRGLKDAIEDAERSVQDSARSMGGDAQSAAAQVEAELKDQTATAPQTAPAASQPAENRIDPGPAGRKSPA